MNNAANNNDSFDISESSHLEFAREESCVDSEEIEWLKWIREVEIELTLRYNLAAADGVRFNADANGHVDGWCLDWFYEWWEEGLSVDEAVARVLPRYTVVVISTPRPLSFRTYARACEYLERERGKHRRLGGDPLFPNASLHINADLHFT